MTVTATAAMLTWKPKKLIRVRVLTDFGRPDREPVRSGTEWKTFLAGDCNPA